MRRGRPIFFPLVALCALGACTTTEVTVYQKVQDARVSKAYINPEANFGQYRRLQAAPLEIYYYEGQGAPPEADLERTRTIFREAFLAAIGDDFPVVDEAGPDVLGIRASLVDMKLNPTADGVPVSGQLRSLVAEGQLTFLMELHDSVSGTVLARAADEEKPGDVPMDDADASWAEVEAAARYWAGLFRDFLDENLDQ